MHEGSKHRQRASTEACVECECHSNAYFHYLWSQPRTGNLRNIRAAERRSYSFKRGIELRNAVARVEAEATCNGLFYILHHPPREVVLHNFVRR
jgi:hypothetical protein